ncbi:MAG TPA: hypothetical protein QGF58_05935 [Myxococcota bacterium]|nr:hypothetical protein [Myxococcota bacterium]
MLGLSALVACGDEDAPTEPEAPAAPEAAPEVPTPPEAPAPSEATEGASADNDAKEKEALEIACAAWQAAKDEAGEDGTAEAVDAAFVEKAKADLEAKGLSMEVGVLGEIAHAAAEDKAGLLGAAVDKHGLLDACAGLTGAMSMSGHAAEGEGEAPAEEKTE